MKKLNKIAIITAFNDVEIFPGGSRAGLKKTISYFDQFLILYESIITNWKRINFDYEIIVLHSQPFSQEKELILKRLNIKVIRVNYKEHPLKIRPMAYLLKIDCDYRLVLDVDMYALNEPDFNFNADAQAMYGGNKYNKNQWEQICKFINCDLPRYPIKKFWKGSYLNWRGKEHYLYQSGKVHEKIFPYFNNGAILIRNRISERLGLLWEKYRHAYTEYVQSSQGIDIDLDGQDVMGLAIDSITKNWEPFPIGFNFVLQDRFAGGRKIMDKYSSNVSLVHYINIPQNSIFYKQISLAYDNVKAKYYSFEK